MGNAPSADLQGTESQRRVVEVMETKDEKSQGFTELATTNSKSKDDGSSIPNPLQIPKLLLSIIIITPCYSIIIGLQYIYCSILSMTVSSFLTPDVDRRGYILIRLTSTRRVVCTDQRMVWRPELCTVCSRWTAAFEQFVGVTPAHCRSGTCIHECTELK